MGVIDRETAIEQLQNAPNIRKMLVNEPVGPKHFNCARRISRFFPAENCFNNTSFTFITTEFYLRANIIIIIII